MLNVKTIIQTALILILVNSSSCNPIYVMQAAIEEGKILITRKPIIAVAKNQRTPRKIKAKLELILAAKKYAPRLGLNIKNSYDYYSHSSKSALTWVLMASPKTSFSFKTWWFPIVGDVPYKGYFKLKSARAAAKELEDQGYETSIRGADAFSTLGWFNDPVVTPFLKRNEINLVDTVFHELVHSSYWIKNHVAFNESLANFVGAQAALEFFTEYTKKFPEQIKFEQAAKNNLLLQMQLSLSLEKLFNDLNNLYATKQSKQLKLKKRAIVFKAHQRQEPALKIFKKINNAELLQIKIYLQDLENFKRLFLKHNSSWPKFWAEIGEISKECSNNSNLEPFKLLKARL